VAICCCCAKGSWILFIFIAQQILIEREIKMMITIEIRWGALLLVVVVELLHPATSHKTTMN
jgi:hypothetical protein